nr:hypothetical protein [Tanacetum cinerariifolium]
MFIKYSTGQIHPKKSRGKGSQGKKTVDDSQKTVDVSKESKLKPEPVKRKTSSKGCSISYSKEQEAADIMQALKESKRQLGTGGSSEGTGTKPGVPDESTVNYATFSEGIDKLDDEEKDDKEGDADDEDDETESDEDDIYKYKICVCTDEDEEMLNAEVDDSDKGDEDITDATKADAKKTTEVKDNPKKVKLPPSSSSFSSPFVLSVPVSMISKTIVPIPVQESPSKAIVTILPPPSVSTIPYVPQQTTTPIPTPTITTDAPIITTTVFESDALFVVQLRVAKLEKMYDDDKAPLAGPNQDKQAKRRINKESESSKKPSSTKVTQKCKAPSKVSKTGKNALAKEPVEEPIAETPNLKWFTQPPRPLTPDLEWNKHQVVLDQPEQPWFNQMVSATKDPLTFNDLMATSIDFSKYVLNSLKIDNLTQDILLGPAYNLLKGTCSSSIELDYHFQEFFNALKDRLDWNNPKGDHFPFDLSKPLPLQGHLGHLTVVANYFFNNDLEYMKSSDPERTYTTSIMKTKAARMRLKGLKIWFLRFGVLPKSGVKSVSVKKLHGYGHLEEIIMKRADRQLYKFKECDFVDLHMNDIEDMMLLAIQHKLFHLTDSDIIYFIVALQIEFKEPYTQSHKPPGVIYKDLVKKKRVMRADELYKFLDGMLKKVRNEIHHRVLNFDLGYNKEMEKRKWTATEEKSFALMVKLIEKHMHKRRIIQNLERLVGARELKMDYKRMKRTI